MKQRGHYLPGGSSKSWASTIFGRITGGEAAGGGEAGILGGAGCCQGTCDNIPCNIPYILQICIYALRVDHQTQIVSHLMLHLMLTCIHPSLGINGHLFIPVSSSSFASIMA